MANWKEEPVSIYDNYPEEDYRQLRRNYTPAEVIIPYKPVERPAWDRHHRTLPPKPARFEKLTRWDVKATRVQSVCKWAVVVAGAAAAAAPTLSHLVH